MSETFIPSPDHMAEREPSQQILLDFYNTFRYSQGSPQTQSSLLIAVARYHLDHTDEEERRQAINATTERLPEFSLPGSHTPQDPSDTSWEFALRLDQFADLLMGGAAQHNFEAVCRQITLEMISSDLGFQAVSRGSTITGRDPHSSMFRDYIVCQRPPHSASYAAIFTTMREKQIGRNGTYWPFAARSLSLLATSWERTHPGKQFFPEGWAD